MENKYFAFIDGNQVGPYELRQLVDAGVRPSTYVWCKGMDDWHRADEVPEICDLFRHHLNHRVETATVVEPVEPVEVRPEEQPEERKRRGPRFARYNIELPDVNDIPENIDNPPQVSMVLAVLSLFLCCPPTGLAAVYFTYMAQKYWQASQSGKTDESPEELRRKAHDYARSAKMWLGITVALGLIVWTLVISVIPWK